MKDKTILVKELSDTFSKLNTAVSRFNEASFNHKIKGGNWSPAMVTQHLVLAGTNFDQLLLGKTKQTEGKADERVAQLKAIFLDFEAKMTSPDFIEPADQSYSVKTQQEKLRDIGKSVINIIPDLDLSLTCLDFEMPYMGCLTRLELISFLIYHTQRHTHQLHQMADELNIN